jgi:FtsH-binding integral membrane protein
MSHSHHERQHHKKKPVRNEAINPMPDGAVYIGLLLIGVFAVLVISVTFSVPWQHLALGYVMALIFLVNLYAWRVYLGHEIAPWSQALARIPLRFAGFGTREGRPLTAAKGEQRAAMTLWVCLAISAMLLVADGYLLVR